MGTDVATMSPSQASALEAIRSMRGGFQRIASKAYRNTGGVQFARFDTSGNWFFGRENKTILHGRDFLQFNMLDMRQGFTAWTNYPASARRKNEKKGEVLRGLREEPIEVHDLPQHKDALGAIVEWKPAYAFTAKFIEGPYKDVTIEIAFSSTGGTGAVADLSAVFWDRAQVEELYIFPIVTLTWQMMETNFGPRPKPVFDIVGWADIDGNEDPDYAVMADDEDAPVVSATLGAPVAPAAPPPPPPPPAAPVAAEGEPEPRRRRRTA